MSDLNKILLSSNSCNYNFIHTDILHGLKFNFLNKNQFLREHYKFLKNNLDEKSMLFPSFNYDFLKSKEYNVLNDKIQVGLLNEFIRNSEFNFRSLIPVFNFISKNKISPFDNFKNKIIDPFDDTSVFSLLNNEAGGYLFYGAKLKATTLIHFVERISGNLYYRYDKIFKGVIINGLVSKPIKLNYHVRPKGLHQEYDWDKIEYDLTQNQLLMKYKSGLTSIMFFSVKKVVDFWLENLKQDSTYFLDKHSKILVKDKLDNLGRAFTITDFE